MAYANANLDFQEQLSQFKKTKGFQSLERDTLTGRAKVTTKK